MGNLDSWLKSGRYLPEPLRDFHDQKDVFKSMHEILNVQEGDPANRVDWITGQCYVIDMFLWFMARRGYTLQRSRQRLPFRDLRADVAAATERRNAIYTAQLKEYMSRGSNPTPTPEGEG